MAVDLGAIEAQLNKAFPGAVVDRDGEWLVLDVGQLAEGQQDEKAKRGCAQDGNQQYGSIDGLHRFSRTPIFPRYVSPGEIRRAVRMPEITERRGRPGRGCAGPD